MVKLYPSIEHLKMLMHGCDAKGKPINTETESRAI